MDTQYETLFAAARRAGAELARTDDATLSRAVVKAAALLRENTKAWSRPTPSTSRPWPPTRPCATACG